MVRKAVEMVLVFVGFLLVGVLTFALIWYFANLLLTGPTP